jgi:predicted kinase
MARAHLLCGPVGSGKTTFARTLERSTRGVRIALDEWMLTLFGEHMPRDLFDERVERCRQVMLGLASRLGELEVDLVLDFGFWRRIDRQTTVERLRAAGLQPTIYRFDVPVAVRWSRIAARNRALPPHTFEITRDMFDAFDMQVELPGNDEGPWIVVDEHGCTSSDSALVPGS